MLFKTTWWRPLRGDPIGWLLDYDDPAVRYWTLTDVLNRSPDTPVVREARTAMTAAPLVARLFELRQPDSGWGRSGAPQTPTWEATADHLVLLAELGAPGDDSRVATAADWALDEVRTATGDFDLPGAFLWALLRFGYGDDPRVRRAVRRAAKFLLARGSPGAPVERTVWDSLPIIWGLLLAPRAELGRGVEVALEAGLAELQHVDWTRLEPERVAFGFPHLGAPDLMFALRVAAAAGRLADERFGPAIDRLAVEQDEQGRWPLAHAHADRLLVTVEAPVAASKWSTLNALRILRATDSE